MKRLPKQQVKPQGEVVRHSRLVCLVSDEELRIIDSYLRQYKNLDQDYPTLFNEHDMRR